MPPKPKQKPSPAAVLRERIAAHLERLGLNGLDVEALATKAEEDELSPLDAYQLLLFTAVALKRERSVEWRIKGSGLKDRKTMATFDWAFQPKLDRRLVEELFSLDFVERKDDLLITGSFGTGKSHILKALVVKACEHEWTVRYIRCVDLVDNLYAGLADGSYERRMRSWCRPTLLVIDDVGLGQLKRHGDEPTAAHMLYTLLDRRHQTATTALSSNIQPSAWGKYLGDATLAGAALDRLSHSAIRIDIVGQSYRQHQGRQRAQANSAASHAEVTQ